MIDWRRGRGAVPVLAAVLACAPRADAQAAFSVSSSTTRLIRTGHTEKIGAVTFTVDSGASVEGTIEIDLSPAVLTGGDRLRVTPGGGFTGGFGATIDAEGRRITLSVPAGMTAGQSVTLDEVRMSAPATGVETIDAAVSVTGNRIGARDRAVRVVSGLVDGLRVDPASDAAYTYTSGRALADNVGNFIFSEGFASAWTGADEAAGTGATHIVVRVSALPRNTQLRFPATILSATGATLTTEPDPEDEMTVRVAGQVPTELDYTFTPAESSPTRIDTFSFSPVLEVTGAPGPGTGFFQVTLGPVGAAEPTPSLPSTAVPRYAEHLLPAIGPELSPRRTFLFPVDAAADDRVFTVSNTTPATAPLTIRAYDAEGRPVAGDGVVNPVTRVLPGNRTAAIRVEDAIGVGAGAVASIEIESRHDRTVAAALGTMAGGRWALAPTEAVEPAFFPFDRSGPGQTPVLTVVAESAGDFSAEWTLVDADGAAVAAVTREGAPRSAVRGTLDALFDIDPGQAPLEGYVRVESDAARFRGLVVDNPDRGAQGVGALSAPGRSSVTHPYFAAGAGFNTRVTLVNASAETAFIRARAYDVDGTEHGSGFATSIPPRAMETLDWSAILGAGADLVWGYFTVEVRGAVASPFHSAPRVAGAVRIVTGDIGAAAALSGRRADQYFFAPVASTEEEATGVVILNRGADAMTVSVEAYAAGGRRLDAGTVEVAPRAAHIGLLRDLTPEAGAHSGGYVRLLSTSTRMQAVAYRMRVDRGWIVHLEAQTAP